MVDTAATLFNQGAALARELALGDLRLRLAGVAAPSVLPSVLFARGIRARLREVFLKEKKWGFIIPLGTEDWTVAEVLLDLALDPEDGLVPELKIAAQPVLAAPPPFIANPGAADPAVVVWPDGTKMELALSNVKPAGRIDPNEDFEAVEDWTEKKRIWVINFLLMLIEWRRTGREATPLPFDVNAVLSNRPARFVRDASLLLLDDYIRLRLAAGFPEKTGSAESNAQWEAGLSLLRAVHPDLAAGYRVEKCVNDIRVWVDSLGNIADEDDEANQCVKLSFKATPTEDASTVQMILKPEPPDILTSGGVHDGFMALMRPAETASGEEKRFFEKMREEAIDNGFSDGSSLRSFLRAESPGGQTFILRIGREHKDDYDRNIIFIEGSIDENYCWLMFYVEATITIDNEVMFKGGEPVLTYFSALKPKNEKPDLNGSNTAAKHARNYISGIVATCVTWHRILAQP